MFERETHLREHLTGIAGPVFGSFDSVEPDPLALRVSWRGLQPVRQYPRAQLGDEVLLVEVFAAPGVLAARLDQVVDELMHRLVVWRPEPDLVPEIGDAAFDDDGNTWRFSVPVRVRYFVRAP